jgi:hypothetical protein
MLAIGSKFEAYVTLTMNILDQAGQSLSQLDGGDYAAIDYGSSLREGIVEAYVGIVQGMKTGDTSISLFLIPSSYGPRPVCHWDLCICSERCC